MSDEGNPRHFAHGAVIPLNGAAARYIRAFDAIDPDDLGWSSYRLNSSHLDPVRMPLREHANFRPARRAWALACALDTPIASPWVLSFEAFLVWVTVELGVVSDGAEIQVRDPDLGFANGNLDVT
ncbi:hypothetical protein G7072_04025 [Nocardioides sp. HDW12B]|uniref:hypothetical protein n=1 Tax=Nocardioides sp. HDW12B TaxID=2714939 RepID=UPI00140B1E95|nr:hypothetical protein [Nocardioides sp. HDW12B]QIK65614.1 hypothetical protein G7072_04025 [Nocardioides sp. HDW12B]